MLPLIKPFVENSVKYAVLCLCAYHVFLEAMPQKPSRKRRIWGGIPILLLGCGMLFIKPLTSPLHILVMVAFLTVNNCVFFHYRLMSSVSLSIIAFGLCFGVFLIVGFVSVFAMYWYNTLLSPDYMWIIDLKTENWINVVAHLIMESLVAVTVCYILKNNQIRKGLAYVADFSQRDTGLYLSVMLFSATTLFSLFAMQDYASFSTAATFVLSFFCIFSLFFWIRHEIKAIYLQQLRDKEIQRLEESLHSAEDTIASLRADNERLSAVIHKDNKLIPALVLSAKRHLTETQPSGRNAAELLEAVRQLETAYAERGAMIAAYEAHGVPLPGTGIPSLNVILAYMQRRAGESGIAFSFTTTDDAAVIADTFEKTGVDTCLFGTVLADLVENALHAVEESASDAELPCKTVAVSMGQTDTSPLFLSVSDSGAAFSVKVWQEMGRKRITTRTERGGSGIGLMTLFSLLTQYRASLTIEEFLPPAPEGFTKCLTIRFDGANARRLISPRAKTLTGQLRHSMLQIGKP